MLHDHHVSFLSEETIAAKAEALRTFAGISNSTWFDVPALIVTYLPAFIGERQPLALRPFDRIGPEGHQAFATFDPPTIHYHRPIWASARLGFPKYRLVLAHEIGHLVLHKGGAKAFLRDSSKQLTFDQENTSAEWQAIIFSYHLLMPDWAVNLYDGARSLASACRIEQRIAEDRLKRHQKKLRTEAVANDRDFCTLCGCICDIDNRRYCSACEPVI